MNFGLYSRSAFWLYATWLGVRVILAPCCYVCLGVGPRTLAFRGFGDWDDGNCLRYMITTSLECEVRANDLAWIMLGGDEEQLS